MHVARVCSGCFYISSTNLLEALLIRQDPRATAKTTLETITATIRELTEQLRITRAAIGTKKSED